MMSTMLPDLTQAANLSCIQEFTNFTYEAGLVYCKAKHDGFLCWEPTLAGEIANQSCPVGRHSDPTKFALRKCGLDGMWAGRYENQSSPHGWTNYTPCFTELVQDLVNQVYTDNPEDSNAGTSIIDIAVGTRKLEITGFTLSLVGLIIAFLIFTYFRALHNHRTRIHKNLFIAMIIQVLIRLTLYIDQAVVRNSGQPQSQNATKGIENMDYLCETCYVFLEYTITSMFNWMLVEGMYLHNIVTDHVLRGRPSYKFYYFLGWGLPAIITAVWAMLNAVHYRNDTINRCWYGYNFSQLYWVLQAPRLAVILINFVFLMGIIRVLVVKLRRTTSNEMEKIRKAVRAALVLLPLLGITNALNMIESPLNGPVWKFAIWSYTTHMLRSFQGLFIAITYCFVNAEVKVVIIKQYENYMALRSYRRNRRAQDSMRDIEIEMPIIRRRQLTGPRQHKVDMKCINSSTTNTSEIVETEFGHNSPQAARCQRRNRAHPFVVRWKRDDASDSENRTPNAQERAAVRFNEPSTVVEIVHNEAASNQVYVAQ